MFRSVSTRKSGSCWLDRIRTAKGTSNPCPTSVPIFDPKQNEDKQTLNVMNDVLYELFNYGDNCGSSPIFKKSARKQANPRVCVFPSNDSDENTNAAFEKATLLRSGDNNSGVERVKELGKQRSELEGEGDGKDWNLLGFSKTEVIVIDTSYECWKFEKLLFKKNNVWQVRDKKGKINVWSKKKRKVSMELECGSEGKMEKADMKGGGREMTDFLVYKGNHLSDKSEVPWESSRKLENGNSSIILIKSIPTSKKNGTTISNSCLRK